MTEFSADDALDALTEAMKGYIDRSFAAVAERLVALDARLATFETGANAAIAGLEKRNPATPVQADEEEEDYTPYPAHLPKEQRALVFDGIVARKSEANMKRFSSLADVPVKFPIFLSAGMATNLAIRWLQDRVEALEASKASPLPYKGVWTAEETYPAGCFVTHGGSIWAATMESRGVKPPAGAWQLAVKKGADGRDAR